MKQRLGRRFAIAVAAVVAVVASTVTVSPAALAAGETSTLQMEFGATGLTTLKSGETFTGLFSLSCASDIAASCDDAQIVIPWPADPDPALGGSGIATWSATAKSNIPGLVNSAVVSDAVNRQWIINIQKPILSDGSAVGIELSFVAPNYTTPDGFQFPVKPSISGSSFPTVTAPDAAVYTVTATGGVSIYKTLPTTPTPGGNLRWSIQWNGGLSSVPGTLAPIPGTRKIVDVLPPEVDFVSVEPANADYTYDPATRTLVFSTDELPVPSGSAYYFINAKVKSDTPDRTILRNTAKIEYQLVGTDTPDSKSSTVSNLVSNTVSTGSLLSKLGYGNLPSGTNGSESGFGNTMWSTAAVSDKEITYYLNMKQDANPIVWELNDPMPCLTDTGAMVASGPSDSLCPDPAFNVSRIKVIGALDSTNPIGELVVHYADGSSETASPIKGEVFTPKQGGEVSRINLRGQFPGGTSTVSLQVDGTIDASLETRTEVQQFRNTMYGRAAYVGNPLPDSYSSASTSGVIVRDVKSAAITATPTQVLTDGSNRNLGVMNYFLASDPKLTPDVRTVLVMPKAPLTSKSNVAPLSSGSDWQGTGRPYFVINTSAYLSTFQVARGTAQPGVYPYDIYAGISGQEFDSCRTMTNGAPVATNDLFIDTTGIIGPVGVPTAVCHQSGYIVVPGLIPDSTTTKMVRGGSDPAWVASPGTSAVKADGTGTADFKVTWANTGSAALQDVTMYDILPKAGDTYTVGNQASRGSTMTPTLTGVTVPSGWTVAYSTAANPCRPEVLAVNPGCDPSWSATAPAQLNTVTGLRFSKASSSAVGTLAEFIISMTAQQFDASNDVAWNTVSTRAYVAGTTPTPIAPTETPRVGFGLVEEASVALVKEVCTTATCDPDAAIGEDGWADSRSVPFDGSATWRVTVTNDGKVDLTDVQVSDPLVSDCAVDFGDLAAGAHVVKTCTSTGLRAAMTNEATVAGVDVNGVTVSAIDTASVTVGAKPVSGVSLVKQVCDGTDAECDVDAAENAAEWSTSTTVPFEGTANWRVIVKNTGVTTLTNVAVSDLANTSCAATIGTLAPYSQRTLECADADLTAGMTNTATVVATPPYGDPQLTQSASASVSVTPAAPSVELVKEVCTTASCDPSAAVGAAGWAKSSTVPYFGTATWRVTLKNTGESQLASFTVTDPLATDCGFVSTGALDRGASVSKVCSSSSLTASLTNEASVAGVDVNGETVSAIDTASVTVGAKPVSGVSLVKQVCDGTDAECDVDAAENAAEWSTSTTVPFEGTANWRVIVKNTGVTTLTNVAVSDLANTSCAATIGTLAPYSQRTLECADADLTAGMTNTATVVATPPYGDPQLTQSASASVSVTPAAPSVELVKEVCTTASCDPSAAVGAAGWAKSSTVPYFGTATWRVTLKNTGESQLASFTVTDPLATDCGFVSTGALDRGASVSKVCSSSSLTASLTNEASVAGVDVNGETVSAIDTASVTVGAKPVSGVEIVFESCFPSLGSCDPDALPGESGWSSSTTVPFEGEGVWRATVTNTGDTTLTDVTVASDDYPDCGFTVASLSKGGSQSKVCRVDSVDGTLNGVATVTATPPYGDEDLTGSSTAKIVSEEPLAQIGVEKEVCSTGNTCDPNADSLTGGWVKATEVEPGSQPFWRIVVTNEGQVALEDVTVGDPSLPGCEADFTELARGERKVIACTGEAAFAESGGTVTVTGTNPRGGASATVTAVSDAKVTVRAFASAVTVVKEACVVSAGSDCKQDGTGWKAHANGAYGSELWWRITVKNTGDTDVSDVAVTDAKFPAGDFKVARLKAGESQAVVISAGAWKVSDPNSSAAKNTVTVSAKDIQGKALSGSASAIGTVDPESKSTGNGSGGGTETGGGTGTGGGSETGGGDASATVGGAHNTQSPSGGSAASPLAITGGSLPLISLGVALLLTVAGVVLVARRRAGQDEKA